MRRLIWGFAGRTYHIVGYLMQRLKCIHIVFLNKNKTYETSDIDVVFKHINDWHQTVSI